VSVNKENGRSCNNAAPYLPFSALIAVIHTGVAP